MNKRDEKNGSRRDFLKLGLGVTALSVCGGCSLFVKNRDPDFVTTGDAGRVRIPLSDFPALEKPGGNIAVEVSGMDDKILVFCRPDGSYSALNMKCTHWGCDVDYDGSRDRIVCPCHGSEYDTDGRNLEGPADQPLTRYTVQIEDAQLMVIL